MKKPTNLVQLRQAHSRSGRIRVMHSALEVANLLLSLGRRDDRDISPMKLIKLVYLCHGWMLALYGRSLIREPIEAWAYGPVIPELYQVVKKYRSLPITENLNAEENTSEFDDSEESVIEQVFDKYSRCSALALSRLTHQPDSPWSITYDNYGQNEIISNDLIQDYFCDLAKVNAQK